MPKPDTIAGALELAAESKRGIRILDRHERATFLPYREILSRARRTAAGLLRSGVQPGDRIALVLPTSPGFLDGFFGALLAGVVPVPLYPPIRLGRLEEYHERTAAMLRAVSARLVVSDNRIRRLLGEPIARAQVPLGCVTVDILAGADEAAAPMRGNDLAFVQFSSGTTASPKPVALTHRQVLANTRAILGAITTAHPEGPELVHAGVSWLPLYHDMGLIGCVLVAVDHPGDLTLIPPELFVACPAIWLRAISTYKGTISPAPNFAYALCADRVRDDELEGVDLSTWRVALNGAEPVAPAVLRRFVDRFAPLGLRPEALTPVYGLAEASLAVTFSAPKNPFATVIFDRKSLSEDGLARPADLGIELVNLGQPLAGLDVRIVNEIGRELSDGRLGRVWVRGPSVMRGYLDQPDATAATLRGEWLDTGDTGFWYAGALFLYGRAKDIIVIRGRNWAPQEIEQVVDEVEGVRTGCSAAVGIVRRDGEELVVLVETTPTANNDLRARVRKRLVAMTGLSASVEVLAPGTLPRTSSGKIRRNDARELHCRGALDPPDSVTPLRLAREMVRSSWKMWRMHAG